MCCFKTSEKTPRLSSISRTLMLRALIQEDRLALTAVEINGRKDVARDFATPPPRSSYAMPFIVPTSFTSSLRTSDTIRFISPDAPSSSGTPYVGSMNLNLLSVPYFIAIWTVLLRYSLRSNARSTRCAKGHRTPCSDNVLANPANRCSAHPLMCTHGSDLSGTSLLLGWEESKLALTSAHHSLPTLHKTRSIPPYRVSTIKPILFGACQPLAPFFPKARKTRKNRRNVVIFQ